MIWAYLLIFVLGVSSGLVLELGYAHIRGRRIIVPFIPRSSRNTTVGGIAVGLVALATVIQVQVSEAREAQCNREQRAALAYNTGVTAEQRALNDKAAQISAARRTLLDNTLQLVAANVTNPARVTQILNSYTSEARTYAARYGALQNERAQLDANRKPYPDPECGR